MPALFKALTPRQLEMAKLVRDGLSNPEIASQLDINVDTVKHTLVTVFNKVGCDNRTMLAVWYERENPGS